MPFNIDALKANIDGYGYLKNSHFEVLISPPKILQGRSLNNTGTPSSVSNILKNLKMRIEQVRAPGISVVSSEVSRYGFGVPQKMPHNAQNQETTFSILVDGYGEIYQFWHSWIRSIFEHNGVDSSRSGPAVNSFPNYLTGYKEDYSTVMQILICDVYGNAIQRINLFEAFPSSIREVPLAWSDNQNLMRLSVSIAFSEFTISGSSVEPYEQDLRSRYSATLGGSRTLG